MSRVYFSTIVRADMGTTPGEFALVDWTTKTTLAKAGVTRSGDTSVPDPNPRGGARGGRGMWIEGDSVYGASGDQITVLDLMLVERDRLSNGLLVGLHEVFMERPGHLWVAATRIDAAVEVDLRSGKPVRCYWPREDPRLQKVLGLVPLDIDKTADNRGLVFNLRDKDDPSHLHLNALTAVNGELHALFSAKGVVVNLEQGRIVLRHDMLRRAHNLVLRGDQLFVTATKHRAVCQFDLPSGSLVRSLSLRELPWAQDVEARLPPVPMPGHRGKSVAEPLFARGLDVVDDNVFVGISPASILQLDWPTGKLADVYEHDPNVAVAIHGLRFVSDVA